MHILYCVLYISNENYILYHIISHIYPVIYIYIYIIVYNYIYVYILHIMCTSGIDLQLLAF